MATYGKKKRSILPSFSLLRASDATGKYTHDKAKKRGSTSHSISAFYLSNGREHAPPNHDDSIEEMADMLLENTDIDQFKTKPDERLSPVASPKTMLSIPPSTGSYDNKTLPQLPQLLFNGDSAWAMNTASVATAAGNFNKMLFSDDSQGSDACPSNICREPAPPIPRRSSKRKSVGSRTTTSTTNHKELDSQNVLTKSKKLVKTGITAQDLCDVPRSKASPLVNAVDVNSKIEAMIAATNSLKADVNGTLLQGHLAPPKKRRLKGHKVLVKMKTAINDRLHARSERKWQDLARDERLLGSPGTEMQQPDEDVSASLSALTTMEIRMNEGDNFKNPKIFCLTGHGNVRRKPIADDGKSLRSRKSTSEDPFAETPQSNRVTRMPIDFEYRHKPDMSMDQTTECTTNLPSHSNRPKDELTQAKSSNRSPVTYDADFDALFSSSPVAQSTPRIRLEPTFEEDGKKKLKHVPTSSRSLFDADNSSVGRRSDVDVDAPPVSKAHGRRLLDSVKRKNSEVKGAGPEVRSHLSKKVKKHPSPSKPELELLQRAMRQQPPRLQMPSLIVQKTVGESSGGPKASTSILGPKDSNAKVRGLAEHNMKGKGVEMVKKQFRIQKSSMIPKPADQSIGRRRLEVRDGYQLPERLDNRIDDSIMGIDELQWDKTAHSVGVNVRAARQYSKHHDIVDGNSVMAIDELQWDMRGRGPAKRRL